MDIMTDQHYASKLRYIESKRLRLVAATNGLISEDLKGALTLGIALGVEVPGNWPPELYDRPAMEFASRQLQDSTQLGWSFWYLVKRLSSTDELLGICGFKGRPDGAGSVEIGYSILSQFRSCGFASEAVSRLVYWAFGHAIVQEVCAETLPHLRQSIRVLEKNGFLLTGRGSERGVVRYAIQRSVLD